MTDPRQPRFVEAHNPPRVPAWRVMGATITGANHHRTGKPGEDALSPLPDRNADAPWIVALADGVGSDTCFRSEQGAHFAVHAAVSTLHDMCMYIRDPHLMAARLRDGQVARQIAERWHKQVASHLHQHPFFPHDQALLSNPKEPATRLADEHAYSTTLLAVAITDTTLVYLQLGDGDIVNVSDTGQVSRPFQRTHFVADETAALGTSGAWRAMHWHIQPLDVTAPALIMLATDGYSNSFRVEDDFLRVAPDLLAMMRDEGIDPIAAALPEWLHEVSQTGSGDDITIAVCVRPAALGAPPSAH